MIACLLPTPEGPLIVPERQALPCPGGLSPEAQGQGEQAVLFSLVVPTYNERENIAPLVKQLTCALDSAVPGNYELIIVDDDSPDGTYRQVEETARTYPQLRLIRRLNERGLSTAVVRGWQGARGDIIGVIDGDLQHPPSVLLALLEKVQQGADVAIASRYLQEGGLGSWGAVRRFLSRGAQALGWLILPEVIGKTSDPMSGFFLLRRSVIAGRKLDPAGYKILVEVLGRGQARQIAEVPFVFQLRQHGQTKVTWRQYIEYVRHLLKLRFFLWKAGS